jgi:hypothetical protein
LFITPSHGEIFKTRDVVVHNSVVANCWPDQVIVALLKRLEERLEDWGIENIIRR